MNDDLRTYLITARGLLKECKRIKAGTYKGDINDLAARWVAFCMDIDPYGYTNDPLTINDALYALTHAHDLDLTIGGFEQVITDIKNMF